MRLFIGLPIQPPLQEDLKRAWNLVVSRPEATSGLRPSSWHLTLAFLDDVAEDQMEPLRHLVRTAVEKPPGGLFLISQFETFPYRNPQRVVAKAVPEKMEEWQKFVNHLRDMVSLVAPNVDRKPWLPHISVTRSKRGTCLIRWTKDIEPIAWTPKEVSIIKSVPGQNGSDYTPLHVFPINV